MSETMHTPGRPCLPPPDELTRLRARVAELEKALKPFSDYWPSWTEHNSNAYDNLPVTADRDTPLRVRDFRAARAALGDAHE